MLVKVGDYEVSQAYLSRFVENFGEWYGSFLVWVGNRFPCEMRRVNGHAIVFGGLDHESGIRETIGLYLFVASLRDGLDGADRVRFELVTQRIKLNSDFFAVAIVFA